MFVRVCVRASVCVCVCVREQDQIQSVCACVSFSMSSSGRLKVKPDKFAQGERIKAQRALLRSVCLQHIQLCVCAVYMSGFICACINKCVLIHADDREAHCLCLLQMEEEVIIMSILLSLTTLPSDTIHLCVLENEKLHHLKGNFTDFSLFGT